MGSRRRCQTSWSNPGIGLVEHAPPGECSARGRGIARSRASSDDDLAFTGRTARYWLAVESQWDDPALADEIVDWTRRVYDTMTPYRTAGRYVNDVSESDEQVVRSVYGDRKYERLVALKRIGDSDNVFRLNQNIRP